jgi:ABC-type branched-subunit amino acid transport system permease subunit
MALAINLLVQVEVFAILAISFNLLLGYAGLFSISQAVFYGLGAYTAGIVASQYGVNLFVGMLAGVILTGIVGAVVGAAAVRVSDEFLVVVTLGLQVIASGVFSNLGITGGSVGLPGIPLFSLGPLVIQPNWQFVVMGAIFLALIAAIAWRIGHSTLGLVLRALRDDQVATLAVGKDTDTAKLLVFIISAMMAAVAGALWAGFGSFVSPDMFNLATSVLIFTMVVVGGTGSIVGSILGAAILVGIPELETFLPLPIGAGAFLQQVLYAILVLLFLVLRPQGILGRRVAVMRAPSAQEETAAPAAEAGVRPRAMRRGA